MTTVAITGSPSWLSEIRHQIDDNCNLLLIEEQAGYVPQLVNTLAALILVDGDDQTWRFWTVTPKASPATRRIPVILVSDNAHIRREALLSGADVTLTTDVLRTQIGQIVQEYARIPDPALLVELECRCEDELPALAREGVEKFNARKYYRQHDLFEAQWMQTEGPIRDLYRAILQVGIAYFQIERGNHRGALKMLLRSVQWLSLLPDACQGIDIRQLRADSYRVRAELEAMSPEEIAQFDRSLLKPLQLRDPIR